MKIFFSKVFLIIRNYLRGIRIAIKGKKIFVVNKNSYCEDGLATNHITDFLKDKKFINDYLEAAKNTDMEKSSHRIIYRAYIVNHFANFALQKFKNQNGCFIELGTHKGLMAKLIILNSNLINEKTNFYLFDTFEGIPIEQLSDEEKKFALKKNSSIYKENVLDFTKKKFKDYDFIKIVQGKLPKTLNIKDLEIENIKFLHIDLNNAYAEIESIKILYDKLLVGSPIVLDDYCYSEIYREQKSSWDDFAKKKNISILSLPTGQGVFFKI